MDSIIMEALETARDDFHTLAVSKEGDFDELGLRNFGSICEKNIDDIIVSINKEECSVKLEIINLILTFASGRNGVVRTTCNEIIRIIRDGIK